MFTLAKLKGMRFKKQRGAWQCRVSGARLKRDRVQGHHKTENRAETQGSEEGGGFPRKDRRHPSQPLLITISSILQNHQQPVFLDSWNPLLPMLSMLF